MNNFLPSFLPVLLSAKQLCESGVKEYFISACFISYAYVKEKTFLLNFASICHIGGSSPYRKAVIIPTD